MPVFDFECKKCGNIFEFSRAFGSKAVPACPACGSKKTEKLITPPAVHFKGSGWYKTDSKAATSAPTKKKSDDAKPEIKPTESTGKKKDTPKKTDAINKGGVPPATGGEGARG